MSQQPLCMPDKIDCIQSIGFRYEKCYKQCSGLWVTSFSPIILSSDTATRMKLSKPSSQYWHNKGFYKFLFQFKGFNNDFEMNNHKQFVEYDQRTDLRMIKIKFDTPVFDRITKDRSAKFVDMLSAIGGTMGLLTGFSIISVVEITYLVFKIVFKYFLKNITSI